MFFIPRERDLKNGFCSRDLICIKKSIALRLDFRVFNEEWLDSEIFCSLVRLGVKINNKLFATAPIFEMRWTPNHYI